MGLRWTAAGMLETSKGFRRLKAHKQLPILKDALEKLRQKDPMISVDPGAEAA